MTTQQPDSKIIVALDYNNRQDAMQMIDQLDPSLCKLKVGKELFTATGPDFVESLTRQNYQVFLDLKFHDIPNTVAKACVTASNLGVWMLNVHASGGLEMMQTAQQALAQQPNKPLLIAVTVLTSMNQATLKRVGVQTDLTEQVLNLASLTKEAGLDGVVCSALETRLLREKLRGDFCLVTPGIRPVNTNLDDQSRVVTPVDAIDNGSSYLVIGRPITQSANPQQTLSEISASIK